ncbi:MAG: CoA transferase [Deltaproteobacteria bacterium]|nr:CoA transferase [Deltaproteobacteria bacterium]
MSQGLLSGYRALDLTDHKGFVCGKILAALGIDVMKIEKPGGDPDRNIPPFYQDRKDPENSLYWAAFNTDKRSITLDIQSPQGQEIFKKLVKNVDFVLESHEPGFLDDLGLGYQSLCDINPRIILTSITPFGQTGPYAHYKGSELIVSAMGGVLLTNGDPDRPPVREGPDSNYFQSNAAAAAGTVLAHLYREKTGQGQHVDVSQQEVAASRSPSNLLVWMFDKKLIHRSGNIRNVGARSTRQFWPCKDGAVFWMFAGGRERASVNQALAQWMREVNFESPFLNISYWEAFDVIGLPKETINLYQESIGRFFMKFTKKELAEEGVKRGVETCMANNPADILEYVQLRERHFWIDLEDPDGQKTLTNPKHFFLCNHTENYVRRRAPRIGENNDDVYINELGLTSMDVAVLKEAGVI